jgi:beta-galactosidase
VTHDRQTKKDVFFFYKANWTTGPLVYITSRRWSPRPAGTADIKVYANSDSVDLALNGTSLGSKASSNHVFLWSGVTLIVGTNTATATGTSAGAMVSDTVSWTGM